MNRTVSFSRSESFLVFFAVLALAVIVFGGLSSLRLSNTAERDAQQAKHALLQRWGGSANWAAR